MTPEDNPADDYDPWLDGKIADLREEQIQKGEKMKLQGDVECACGENTDPNLVEHKEPGKGYCTIRPRRIQPGDPGFVPGWEKPARVVVGPDEVRCSACGELKGQHARVQAYTRHDQTERHDTEALICPRATFTPYR